MEINYWFEKCINHEIKKEGVRMSFGFITIKILVRFPGLDITLGHRT